MQNTLSFVRISRNRMCRSVLHLCNILQSAAGRISNKILWSKKIYFYDLSKTNTFSPSQSEGGELEIPFTCLKNTSDVLTSISSGNDYSIDYSSMIIASINLQ